MSHPFKEELNYNYIADGIYIGTNQCCQTHFSELLIKEGISADISLEKDRVDAPYGVDFYIWIPIKDHAAPDPGQLEFGVAVLEKIVAMGKKVYVHCKNGHGRAPTLVAAYLIKNGQTLEDAITLIKSKRPSVHLQEAQKRAIQAFTQSL